MRKIKSSYTKYENHTHLRSFKKHDSTISRHLMDFKNKQKLAPENGGSQSLLKADQTEK
jgi:hypothetical protein